MIVEDDPKIADLLKSHIVKYGYNVHVVKDFDRVMDEFRSTAPDLVLLDINLPSFDGYYWCRQIRQESICPVLFISARTGEMDQVMALENGGDDFITKPFHAEIVMAKYAASFAGLTANTRRRRRNGCWKRRAAAVSGKT